MYRVVVSVILGTAVFAQDAPDPEIARAAKSPYDFARYIDSHPRIDDWKPLWIAMGNTGDPPKELPRCAPKPADVFCSTELITVLDPSQVIVLLQADSFGYDTYLRFLEEGGAWKFAGSYSAAVLPRRHELFRFGSKPFLKIAERGVRAGGLTLERELWFDLTQPTFKPVFSFPVQASFNAFAAGIGRKMEGYAVQNRNAAVDTISLTLEIQFYFAASDLGSQSFGATYERSRGETKFTIRRASSSAFSQSAIPVKAFEELADIVDGPSTERMLIYALPGLRRLAAGNDAPAKDDLRRMLESSQDTIEKRTLLDLLRN